MEKSIQILTDPGEQIFFHSSPSQRNKKERSIQNHQNQTTMNTNVPMGELQGIQFIPLMSMQNFQVPNISPAFNHQNTPNIQHHAFVVNVPVGSNPGSSAQSMGSAISAVLGSIGASLQDPLLHALQASLHQGNKSRKPSASSLNGVFHACLQDGEIVECPITSDTISAGEWISRMPCGHYFSHSSLSKWLTDHNTCPVCRYELHTGASPFQKYPFILLQ